jgi:uncharacterized protein
MPLLPEPVSFEWDEGNARKNLKRHDVTAQEIEEAFFDPDKKLLEDPLHSGTEERHILLGQTREGRALFVAFTMRDQKIRAISARDLNRRERSLYEEET